MAGSYPKVMTGIVVLIAGVVMQLQMGAPLQWTGRTWSLFLLVPVAYTVISALPAIRLGGFRAAMVPLLIAIMTAVVAFVFAFVADWSQAWPIFIIGIGVWLALWMGSKDR
jgi:phosphatidylserine synthase